VRLHFGKAKTVGTSLQRKRGLEILFGEFPANTLWTEVHLFPEIHFNIVESTASEFYSSC